MRAGLIGATGLVGQEILQQLLQDDECSALRVWARRAETLAHPKQQWCAIDFDQLENLADFSGLDVVFCALGTTQGKAGRAGLQKVDHDYVLACARAARKAGIERFVVVSSLGASAKSPSFYSRVKAAMQNDLRELGFASLEIVQPSLLLGERDEARPAEMLGQKMAPVMNLLLPRHYRAISGADVARAMIHLAKAAQPGCHIRRLPLDASTD